MKKQKKEHKKKQQAEPNIDKNIQQEAATELQDTKETVADEKDLLQEEKDKYLRLYAEFENFRRRTAREKLEMFETASEKVIKNLLPVLDDFERAIAEMKKSKQDELVKGTELIYDKLLKTLEKEGLKVVEVKAGDEFDPDRHEAVAQIPAPNKKMKNKIIDIVEKGYQLGNKIIRFPKVVTGM